MRNYSVFLSGCKKRPSYYGQTRADNREEALKWFADDYSRKNNYSILIKPEDFEKATIEFYT